MRRTLATAALALAATLALAPAARADDPPPPAPEAGPERPRLVLVIVIDQCRADYFERFLPFFGERGFRRLLREGAVYSDVRYRHATTYTGPGHATIATGGHGSAHGIVGNRWFDRATGRKIYCAEDPEHRSLVAPPRPGAGTSPRNLTSSTFGDELVMARGRERSRVVTVSVKDRGALFLAGRLGEPYFFDGASGAFTTTTFYAKEQPAFAAEWAAARPLERFRGKTWDRALPAEAYAIQDADDRPFEIDVPFLGRTFPHPLPGAGAPPEALHRAIMGTPFGNEVVLDFARAVLRAKGLGRRPGETDVLAVSLSSVDYVGHNYGPRSHEVLDGFARLDGQLARFLDDVDAAVGLDRTLLALTADHGVGIEPEVATSFGFSAGRIDPKEVAAAADRAADRALGAGDWVLGMTNPGVYFDPQKLAAAKVPPEALEALQRAAAREIAALPGIALAFAHADLAAGRVPATDIGRAVQLAFHPARSGDVVVVQAPYWFLDEAVHDDCATHSSPYAYDAHVPLLLRGPGIRPGRHERAVSPADLAPTIGRWLGIERPTACDGTPLFEALPGAAPERDAAPSRVAPAVR